ncbi:MAG TPA: immunoglobulin domain-containing protein, partial [Tepidisphaeraceae bacterium]|nr:immunoglobulin domain-containing protein [Tepidisphaeraceae bacterium]
SYTGKYFFADYCRTYVKSFDPATAGTGTLSGGVVNLDSLPYFATQVPARPVDVDVAPSGDVYVLSRGAESGGTGLIGVIRYTASDVPSINEQPQSRTVTAGQPVTFRVVASGPGPLSYQWQRNGVDIPGATDTSYTIDRVQATDDGARFRVVVRNPHGSTPSNEAVLTVTENRAPTGTITITAPSGGGLYTAGGPISFSGSATDPEQGTLPAGAFTWRVDFHHDEHFHPAMPETTGSTTGTYNVPTAGETSANVWYRVHLTVTDEGGLTHSTFTDVHPQTAQVTLATNPTGLSLDLDGQPRTAPHVFSGVTGIVRSLAAPPTQTVGGVTYEFVGWSDGGAPQHTISTPASNTTYTATYRRVARVLGRQVFYSRSRFDSDGAASGPGDDGAIATDKAALLPGQTASFANYTSYGRGINGIMIDLDNGGAPVGAADFTFRAGRDGDPAAWDLAPQPLRIERRAGAGAGGSDRVTVVWADGAIRNKWLQVTYLPQGAPASSLSRDVFYFGNLVGEIGDAASLARVSATDLLETRRKLRTSGLPLTDRHDVNRDGRISVTDFALIRRNLRTTLPAVATGTAVFSATPISAASISDEVLGS